MYILYTYLCTTKIDFWLGTPYLPRILVKALGYSPGVQLQHNMIATQHTVDNDKKDDTNTQTPNAASGYS